MKKITSLRGIMCISLVLPTLVNQGAQYNKLLYAYKQLQKNEDTAHCWGGSARTAVPALGAMGIVGGLYSYFNRAQKPTLIQWYAPVVSGLCTAYSLYGFARATHQLAQHKNVSGSWLQKYCTASYITARHFFMGGRGLDQAAPQLQSNNEPPVVNFSSASSTSSLQDKYNSMEKLARKLEETYQHMEVGSEERANMLQQWSPIYLAVFHLSGRLKCNSSDSEAYFTTDCMPILENYVQQQFPVGTLVWSNFHQHCGTVLSIKSFDQIVIELANRNQDAHKVVALHDLDVVQQKDEADQRSVNYWYELYRVWGEGVRLGKQKQGDVIGKIKNTNNFVIYNKKNQNSRLVSIVDERMQPFPEKV
jgi:hypothetical protein